MGWVTAIRASAQVDYRLSHSAGCGLGHEHDASPTADVVEADPAEHAVEYRLDSSLPLRWIGSGLPAVGLTPGADFAVGDEAKARMLMAGLDPRSGEILVKPKLVTDPRGTLPAAVLLAAIDAAAAAGSGDVAELLADHKWAAARHGRAQRGVVREGDSHRIPYTDARRLAGAAGVDLTTVYDPERLAEAGRYANAKLRVGLMGSDVVFDLTKSVSEAWALAPADLAQEILDLHLASVTEAIGAYEGWASYTMRGEHGDGKSAQRLESGGFLGWTMGHQVARPVGDAAPDPHVHIHVTLAHMVQTLDDEKWRTPGAGGRDLMRHAHAVDALAKALFRQTLTEKYGVEWVRDEVTGAWEMAGVPAELCREMSKRHGQIDAEKQRLGLVEATRGQDKTVSASTREAKAGGGVGGELRAEWRRQAEAVEVDGVPLDVDAMVAAAIPDWPNDGLFAHRAPRPPMPTEELAAKVFHPTAGVTAHHKAFRRAELLARIADELPGIGSATDLEAYADQLLADERFALLMPELGASHMSNHQRYTTPDIYDAELTILYSARDRLNEGAAVVPQLAVDGAVGIFEATRGYALSEEQRAAVTRFLRDGHGVDALVGVAGAGKTTLLSAAYDGWTAAGNIVRGCSTAATAAANLQSGSGIPSTTLASWLVRIREGDGLAGVDVLVVDEAGMVDDRQLAEVMRAAAETGTKVVLVGDGKQLRSPGVGGSFDPVHRVVEGLALTENRRQVDEAERLALAVWRDGDRKAALSTWADAGRVHAVAGATEAFAAMLARWDTQRAGYDDPHAQIDGLLMLAATNADVATLNAGARAIRIENGEIGQGRAFALAGGGELNVSVGDLILTRVNDYRSAKSHGERPDVLNGYRGVVTSVSERGISVRLAEGAEPVTLSANYISRGGVQLGYAMTAAKSQGLTSREALVYGAGLDDHTLYPAMSRDRERVDLYLPHELLEDADTRIRLGEPATNAEALDRAIAAMVKQLEQSAHDIMVSVELGHELPLPAPRTPTEDAPAPVPEPTRFVPDWPMAWERRYGAWTDYQLDNALAKAVSESGRQQIRAVTCQAEAKAADAGAGPAMTRLRDRANTVAAQAQAIEAYRTAQADYHKAEATLDKMRAELADAKTRYREATGLFNRGERKAAAADMARFDRDFPGALDDSRQHQAEATSLYRKVPRGEDLDAIIAERDHYLEQWAEQLDAARTRDAAHAKDQRVEAGEAVAAQKAADATAGAIRAEASLRKQMPSAARAIEDGVRQFPTMPAEVTTAARQAIGDLEQIPQQYAAWNTRPFGQLADRTLDERAIKYDLDAEAGRLKAQAFQGEADAVRQKAAAYGGPTVAELGPQQQRLEAAAAVDVAAEPIRTRQQEALDRYTKATSQQIDLEIKRDTRSTTGNWMHGATKGGLNERITALKAEAAAADKEMKAAAGELGAMGAGKAGAAVKTLEEFRENLPELREQARAQDIADAEPDAQRLERRAEAAQRDAAKATGNAAGVAAEKALRAELPGPVTGMENISRTENRRVIAAEKTRREEQRAAARQRERTQTRSHEYDPPSYGVDRSGPSLGR